MLRHHYDLETFVLFIDLVKAFDSIQLEVLYTILKNYGLPLALVKVIKKLYSNSFINITVGKEKKKVLYETGIQQGDNMAPILFLFVMQAILESLETALPVHKPEYRYFKNGKG